MQIVRHKPITRGVTELMYVGDDDAIDKATTISKSQMALGAGGLILMLCAKSKLVKAFGAGLVVDVAVDYVRSKAG